MGSPPRLNLTLTLTLTQEHAIPFSTRNDGALLIGPFDLKSAADNDDAQGVLPAELLFALQVLSRPIRTPMLAIVPTQRLSKPSLWS